MENEVKKKKMSAFDIVTIVASLGLVGWMLTDFMDGGMFLFLIVFRYILIPFILIYLVTLVCTLVSLFRRGVEANKIRIISHGIVILFVGLIASFHSDVFKSKRILTATLKDDLFHYTLVFRKNGDVENQIIGFMGYTNTIKGMYFMKGDTIIFTRKPYDNDFIPDTVLVNRKVGAIFIDKNKAGEFATEKEWLNHFDIHP